MPDLSDIFVASLKKHLEGQPYGIKTRVAKAVGISPSHLGDIIAQRTYGTEEKRRAIAAYFGYPDAKYEEFLNIGRRELGLMAAVDSVSEEVEPLAAVQEPEMVMLPASELNLMRKIIAENEEEKKQVRERERHYLATIEQLQKELQEFKNAQIIEKAYGKKSTEITGMKSSESVNTSNVK